MPGLPVPVAADTCALRCASSVNLSSADAWTSSLARRTRLNGGRARIDARGGVLQPAVSMARLLEQIDDVPPPGYLPKASLLARVARPGGEHWGCCPAGVPEPS